METKEKQKALYTFNWVGGGMNQVHAHTKKEALEIIAREFPGNAVWKGEVNLSTLKRVTSKKGQDRWYASLPLMD